MASFQKSFDELLDAILTDWRNQFPEADTSQGSLIFIKSACMASALWGLYKYQDWITAQIFPDTAETAQLEHHAWVRGLTRTTGETDAELLTRLLEYIRRAPAGGNQYDYIKWALEIDYVAQAWCFPLAQGLGTVDVVITADADTTGSEIPSNHAMTGTATSLTTSKLVDSAADFTASADPVRVGDVAVNDALATEAAVSAVDSGTQLTLASDIFTVIGQAYTIKSLVAQVQEHIDDVRPVTASAANVRAPSIATQDITVTIVGSGVDTAAIATEITAILDALIPGETLYRSRLVAAAIQEGATNAVVTLPTADVTPAAYAMIRPGAITVQ